MVDPFLKVQKSDSNVTIQFLDFAGQVDYDYLKEVFNEILAKKPKEVYIDLGQVEILGSLVISKILSFKNKTNNLDITVKIINVKPNLLEIFKQLNLDVLFGLS